jgi:hypothetical protein
MRKSCAIISLVSGVWGHSEQHLPCDHILVDAVAAVLQPGTYAFGMTPFVEALNNREPAPCTGYFYNKARGGMTESTARDILDMVSLVPDGAARAATARGVYKFLKLMTPSVGMDFPASACSGCLYSSVPITDNQEEIFTLLKTTGAINELI